MNTNNKLNPFKNLKFDIASGIVVFFVALPLCLGISLASTSYSNVPNMEDFPGIVFPGIIAGIIGGIVVGTFSGSRFGVSGPAAGLISIVSVAIVQFGGFDNGGFEKFVLAVFLAGVIQVILGFLKAGFIAYYIPFSVIKGMLAGIGVIIISKEIPHFLGYDKDPEGESSFLQADGHNTISEIYYAFENYHVGASIVAIVSVLVLLFWGIKAIKNNKILSLIPGPLLAIIISVAVSLLFVGSSFEISKEHLVNVPTPNSIDEFKSQFRFPTFSAITDYNVWIVALIIAVVASIETLLCVEATDKLDPYKGQTPMDKELKAQGIGNMVSGFLGGLPITQVIVRSSANINAGAQSKKSAIIHGVFLMVFVVLAPSLLNMIPRSTLAAVLILIGVKLINPKQFVAMYKVGLDQFIPFVITIVVMYFTDLLTGVGVGLGVAILWILYRNFKQDYFLKNDGQNPDEVHLCLSQHATFLNKANIVQRLSEIPNGKKVIIDLSKTIDVDYDIKEAIMEFTTNAIDREIEVEIIDKHKITS